ncbi:MAG TPA: acyl-CoA dehydrogenase family protein [Nocardioidaceae bacterium]|nr:acyl-CoA dehydrogenase family protein [Nocardioidaceae bacterium]
MSAQRPSQRGITTYRRDVMGSALAVLNKLAQSRVIDRLGMRKPTERVVFETTKTGFRTIGAVSRTFTRRDGTGPPARLAERKADLFDLTPTEDQQMIVSVVREFADEVLRPGAEKADATCVTSDDVLERSLELGLTLLEVPEAAGGLGAERSTTTAVLVAEALAHGDLGMAVACLSPASVATALSLWGDGAQQQTYLSSFTGSEIPAAALAVAEPRPLFDPFQLATTAVREGGGYVLNGTKSMVVRAADAELFVIAAEFEDTGPALFLLESDTRGLEVEAEPSMGLRAASLSRVICTDVAVPRRALLGDGRPEAYAECIRLSRLAWCALAIGTGQAVLDYVIPYVKERQAFGEPIAHRQSVAFLAANIGIELEGMRLATYRAAARAEQGRDFAREVALARRLCAEHGMRIGSDGVQLLGGHGFVKEHPVERWYRDLRAIGVMEGGVLA